MLEKNKCLATRDLYGYWQKIETRWIDNDIYGHINNAVYYEYIDSIINSYLINQDLLDPLKSKTIGLVAESHCQFCRPARYPISMDGGLRVEKIGSSSVRYEIGMFAEDKDEPIAVGGYTHVFVERVGCRPTPVPQKLRKVLGKLIKKM